jgi:hypothetical protein
MEVEMAELTELEEKVAEVWGLAQAAQKATEKVAKLFEEEGEANTVALLEQMGSEAASTDRRCEEVASSREGKKTAIAEKARETKQEAVEMMQTYLGEDADALDGLEFLIMAEAGELGHVEIVGEYAQVEGDSDVQRLVEEVLPVQERHFADIRKAALAKARSEASEEASS